MSNFSMGILADSGATAATRTYINTNTDGTNTSVYTFTNEPIGTPVSDRRVFVCISSTGVTSGTVSGVKFGGVAGTLEAAVSNTESVAAIYSLVVASGTTSTIEITFTGSKARCGIAVYTSTGQAAAQHDSGTTTASFTAAASSISINVPANGFVISTHTGDGFPGKTFTWANITEDADISVEGGNTSLTSASDNFATIQTGLAAQVTPSASIDRRAQAAVSYGPA